MALRWGIAAAGKISNDFVCGLSTLDEHDHTVVAVGARDLDRATEFAQRFGIPNAHGTYQQLAEDQHVQVVYVGSLNPQHFDIARLMLEHGKHVLVEKPLTLNAKGSRELIAFAQQRRLFLMEAIWSRCLPSYKYVRDLLESDALGEITSVDVDFGFELEDVDRVSKREMGGGTILDLGVYTIQLAQMVFQQPPRKIEATGQLNSDGVDLDVKAKLVYGPNKVANIHISALKTLSNTATIVGTKGKIVIPNFWSATTLLDIDGSEKSWPLPTSKYKANFFNSVGLRYEAEEVRQCILSGKIASDLISHEESLTIARIQDEIRKQVGVHFDEDD